MTKDLFNEDQEHFVLKNFKAFSTLPNPPETLTPLLEIANNMWWCWNNAAIDLFRRISDDLWEKSSHNPIGMLGMINQEAYEQLASDDSFVSTMKRVYGEFRHYMDIKTWYQQYCSQYTDLSFAYFSTEYAIHESIPIYSGGLGVLSGDHLKSASDLGLPLVAVGLLYRYGYFKQHLNSEGLQQEEYTENHFSTMPLERVKNSDGSTLIVDVPFAGNNIAHIRAWKLQIGRVPLYLLDTDFDANIPYIREITGELYGGNRDMRIRQEIVLGIGGTMLLKALNINPSVVHINEGHSAFLLYEKVREAVQDKGLLLQEAIELVKSGCVFTTHTPVPAGNESFDINLAANYLEPLYKDIMSKDMLLQFGAFPLKWGEHQTNFSMTILALKFANKANGVSRLHATIARDMWSPLYPGLPKKEVPISHITNGIHTNTWISYGFGELFDRYLGSEWKDKPADHTIWDKIQSIPDTELWRAHERRKERLISFSRLSLRQQYEKRGLPPKLIAYTEDVLDPEALTIGFARRFATYKRGDLIFRDLERLKKILTNRAAPVQIIISGKSHPQDAPGKKVIQDIVNFSKDEELRNKIIFLEDYDMNIAHYLVQGADVWLNNPIRPQEASGTSGMKAAINGVLNLSILDGWWCEGYDGNNGWVIGSIEKYSDRQYQDDVDSRSIYDQLEREIIPLFFAKSGDGIPRNWVKKMKASMMSLGSTFNTNRMVEEYTKKFYIPSSLEHNKFCENNYETLKKKAQWSKNINEKWSGVQIISYNDDIQHEMRIGEKVNVTAKVCLGGISPNDVSVQVYRGFMDSKRIVSDPHIDEMSLVSQEDGDYTYQLNVSLNQVGHRAYAIRILPKYDGKVQYIPERILWI